ncbi:Histone H4 [Puccinia graminis f. sp. tritici]|uniref:Histone H4 n=1 Tax=Puccinia graminis f. sp. tritici TaxID=56615 RepID=A0A5B0LYD5_PUCGR|nr:Histone H4 [Puccinia graminis f. sp. tritici]
MTHIRSSRTRSEWIQPPHTVQNCFVALLFERSAGRVKRIAGLIYGETRDVLNAYVVTYTEHATRKPFTSLDVVYALKQQGRTLYCLGA